MRLVSISSQEVASVIPISVECVVVTHITVVEMNMTVVISFSCVVGESGFESEIDK